MRHKTLWNLILGVVALFAFTKVAHAQMGFSFYNDSSISDDFSTVTTFFHILDNSSCGHSNYVTTVGISSPDGRNVNNGGSSGLYSQASISINNIEGTYSPYAYVVYYCDCFGSNSSASGSGNDIGVLAATTILSNGSLNGAVQEWQDNGDGTFTLKLSPLAYDFLADNGFVAVAAPLIFVPGVGEVIVAVGGVVIITVGIRELYKYWVVHKDDPPPNLPKPKNAPTGTIRIDQFRNPALTHEQVEDVKSSIGNKRADWTGIAPNGDVIASDLDGNAENFGPWRALTNH